MHDIRAVRADPAAFDAALGRRGLATVSADLLARDAERRAELTALQEKQARRNALAREIGQGKRTGADTSALETEATALRNEMEPDPTSQLYIPPRLIDELSEPFGNSIHQTRSGL